VYDPPASAGRRGEALTECIDGWKAAPQAMKSHYFEGVKLSHLADDGNDVRGDAPAAPPGAGDPARGVRRRQRGES
jgi:hypothetical protein